jgi:putative nucleotidyltransferase with HDIG domain
LNETILLSEVISALSLALDLTEGQPMGHAIRSCLLGIKIGQRLGLDRNQLSDLYYALLLKDSGCSTNSARMHQILGSDDLQAKREVKLEDWTKFSLSGLRYVARNASPQASILRRVKKIVQLGLAQKHNNKELISARCERGAEIARKVGFNEATSKAIQTLDEHWNGGGYPEGLNGQQIPLLARIINVSQTLEVFAAVHGPATAIEVLLERSGTWFDPEVVKSAAALESDQALWQSLQDGSARESVLALESGNSVIASPERIDSLCQAFAQIVDAKSPFTFQHSLGVSKVSVEVATQLGLGAPKVTMIRRAALLHDIGKLGVSNSILDKPGKLTDTEWVSMKMHPVYTRQILEVITGFEELAYVAGAHHEKLDGTGYPNKMTAAELTLPARIIAVADVFQALSETRSYREGLPADVALKIIASDAPHKLDRDCFDALKSCYQKLGGNSRASAQAASQTAVHVPSHP